MLSDKIRSDFPILTRQVHGKSLVYLDNAATTQKPQAVIDALVGYYSGYNSNVHRGVHQLSQEATDAFEAVRRQLQEHLHAAESHEIILTKGTTDSLNLVAHGFRSILKPEDEIIVTQLEHHSNLVPWQAHKMYGPTGVGLLYGKTAWLETLPPYQGGGEMISEVAMEQSSYAGLPHKFEAGTPNIAGVIGWGAALSWMQQVGLGAIEAHEQALLAYGTERLLAIPGVKMYGVAPEKAAVLSFNVAGVHPYDVGTLLDQMGIAVRTGQHCTQPIMDCFGIPGTIRASLAAYTSREDLDALAHGLEKAIALLV
ncbi:MAG: aminotransferase class V-fold PLP-dependent enzyme [Flavobacteriia bacterium]|nr:aminotransferase class V-fold PLP-dependent enzyme [Flavobacteriia bacterium]